MKFTMKSDYALRAVLDLAQHYDQGPIQANDIASRQLIPEQYLDQIFASLRKLEVIKSIRGPQGGYVLAQPPSKIYMGEIVGALEGYVAPMNCVPEPTSCEFSPSCTMREIWVKVDAYAHELMMQTTIEEMAKTYRKR